MSQFFHERIERGTAAKTVPLPALSPAFAYADDAARFAHEADWRSTLRASTAESSCNTKTENFATLPVKGESRMFSHELVLSTDADNNFAPPRLYLPCVLSLAPNNYAEVKRYLRSGQKSRSRRR